MTAKRETKENMLPAGMVVKEFFDASTIHGLKYLGTRPLYEKLLWSFIFLVSLTLCGIQIKATWDKWINVPVIVTFNENLISIADIPFPAVTICHQIKAEREHFDFDVFYAIAMDKNLKNIQDVDDSETFEVISQMCIKDNSRKDVWKIVQKFKNDTDIDIDGMMDMSPPFKKTFTQCGGCMSPDFWKCNEVFSEVLIEDGFCYTFNLLRRDELLQDKTVLRVRDRPKNINWPAELGGNILHDNDELDELDLSFREDPLRAYTTGQKLQVRLLSNNSDFSRHCQGSGDRFKVFLHSPYELPSSSSVHQSYDVDIRQSVILSVMPRLLLASDSLQATYTPATRRCYFHNERTLRYFRTYTKKNCEIECLSNITLAKCSCVPFWLPRDSNTTRICSLKNYYCVQKKSYFHLNLEMAAATMTPSEIMDSNDNSVDNKKKKLQFEKELFGCNCLASCKSISYEANVREIRLVEQPQSNGMGVNETTASTNKLEGAKLVVQFSESEFFALKRTELYGFSDFIASCGGLLGLFMGCSLLSFVEVVYFFTFRFFPPIRAR